jgi:hypothetical protein
LRYAAVGGCERLGVVRVLHQDQFKRQWVGAIEAGAWKSFLENNQYLLKRGDCRAVRAPPRGAFADR